MREEREDIESNFCTKLYDEVFDEYGTSLFGFDGTNSRILVLIGQNKDDDPGFKLFNPGDNLTATMNVITCIVAALKFSSERNVERMKKDDALMYVLTYNIVKAIKTNVPDNPESNEELRQNLTKALNDLDRLGIRFSLREGGTVLIDNKRREYVVELRKKLEEQLRIVAQNGELHSVEELLEFNKKIAEANRVEKRRITSSATAKI